MSAGTTPRILVPKQRAENPGGGNEFQFAPGAYLGTIEAVRTKDFPPFVSEWTDDDRRNRGYDYPEGATASLQLGSIQPLESQTDPGNRKFFSQDVVIRDGAVEASDPESTNPDRPWWQLRRGVEFLTNLAIALGQTDTIEDDTGEYYAVADGFFDELLAGSFNGQQVTFTVYHRPWKSKAGKEGVEVGIKSFDQAV